METAAASTLEVVGRFEEREPFEAAVKDLLAQGFSQSDLSLLDTHQALSVSGTAGQAWQDSLTGLVGEIKYVGPITAAGLIAVATGPVGAAVAAGIAAGLTGAAVGEFLQNIKATPHTEDFARALELGAVLLWVRVEGEGQKAEAERILRKQGAHDVHCHRRPLESGASHG